MQTRQFLPTKNILAVERVDESAFQTPNVFQMVSKDDDGALQILYLATQVRAIYSLKHSLLDTQLSTRFNRVYKTSSGNKTP